ncbi:contractile injection system tape measure protein [Paraburkholderia sp. J67]|uniref:contractile injection system tape measure protein n=1 Tax=Paraburkholderia sp. J67 TaxID=2805435 RepID=UPI002ABD5952|nr:contractile injection system tape measure protein [Paraburkholderia sp. J67]
MKAHAAHSVKTLRLDVQLRSGTGRAHERGKAIQQRLGDYCREQLEQALQPCFDEAAGDARVYQIRRIELDLGQIPPGRLEAELGERLRSALRDQLRRLGLPRPARALAVDAGQEAESAYWQALRAWLESGTVTNDHEPAGLLQKAMLHEPARLARMLRDASRLAELSGRLVTALPEPVVEALVGVLEPGDTAYIVGYVRQLRHIPHAEAQPRLDRPGFGTALWTLILNYLLDSRGSEFNRRAFVSATLSGMASRYQLDFDALLIQLTQAVERVRSREGRSGGLLDTLYALRLPPDPAQSKPGVTVIEPGERQLQRLTALLQGRADRFDVQALGVLEVRLAELAKQQPAALQAALRAALRTGDARRRLLRGLSPQGRRRLWQWLAPAQSRRIGRLLGWLRHELQSAGDVQLELCLDEAALGYWTIAPAALQPAAFARGVLTRYADAQPMPARVLLHGIDAGDVSFGAAARHSDEPDPPPTAERLQHWLRIGIWRPADGLLLHEWLDRVPERVVADVALAVGPVAAVRIVRETAPAWRERLLRLLAGERADALFRLRASLPAAARRLRLPEHELLRQADLAWLTSLLDAAAVVREPSEWVVPLAEALSLHTLRDYREVRALVEGGGAVFGRQPEFGEIRPHSLKRAATSRRMTALLPSRGPRSARHRVRSTQAEGRGDQTGLAHLIALFANGTPPPWDSPAQHPQRSFQRLLANQPEALLDALRKALLRPGASARLLRWLPVPALRQLVLTLNPGMGGLVLSWLHAGSALADSCALTGAQRRQAGNVHWEVALSLLLRPHGEGVAATSFLDEAAGQAAHRLRLAPARYRQDLLAVASRGAGRDARYAVLAELLGGEGVADFLPEHVPEPAANLTVRYLRNQRDRAHIAEPASRDHTVLAALEDLLRYGHSLTHVARAEFAVLGAALAGWPAARRRLWRRFFQQALKEPLQRRRLASLLPSALLLRLLPLWLTSAQVGIVTPLLERFATLAVPPAQRRSHAQTLAWEALLERVADGGRGSHWSVTQFLTTLAELAARQYELAPLPLLAALERSLPGSATGAREEVRKARRMAVVETFPTPPSRPVPFVDPRKQALPDDEPLYVSNAGLVLLWPFFTRYFEILGLVDKGAFVDEAARSSAVYLLQYLASGNHDAPEHMLALNKLLCGMPFEQAPEFVAPPSVEAMRIGRDLLHVVTQRWDKLRHTSVEGLQQTFLMREGRLLCQLDMATLTIPQKTVDILLDSLTAWSFTTIRLPWMPQPLFVNWR